MNGRHSPRADPAGRGVAREWARSWIARAFCLLLLVPTSAALTSADVPFALKVLAAVALVIALARPAWSLVLGAALLPMVTLIQPASTASVDGVSLIAGVIVLGALLRLGPNSDPAVGWPALVVFGAIVIVSWGVATRDHWPSSIAELLASAHPAIVWLEGLGLAAIAARVGGTDRRRALSAARVLTIGVCFAASASIIAAFRSGGDILSTRISPVIADPNAAGSWFALFSVAAVWLAGTSEQRWRWLPITAVLLVGLWLTGSRAALASTLVVLFVSWAIARRPRPLPVLTAGSITTLAIAALILMPPARKPQASAAYAAEVRIEMAKVALAMTRQHPIAGAGPGNFQRDSAAFISPELVSRFPPAGSGENAHNNFLQILAELGVPGLLAFLWLVAAPQRRGWRAIHKDFSNRECAALCAGLSAFLLTCLAGHPLLSAPVMFSFQLSAGLVVGLSAPASVRRS